MYKFLWYSVPCGINFEGLRVLYFLQKRGGTFPFEKFLRIYRKRIDNLDLLLTDLKERGLILLTRDGRRQVIRLVDDAQTTDILLEHDQIPPPHHRHPTRLQQE
jgi:hypothetical protein